MPIIKCQYTGMIECLLLMKEHFIRKIPYNQSLLHISIKGMDTSLPYHKANIQHKLQPSNIAQITQGLLLQCLLVTTTTSMPIIVCQNTGRIWCLLFRKECFIWAAGQEPYLNHCIYCIYQQKAWNITTDHIQHFHTIYI